MDTLHCTVEKSDHKQRIAEWEEGFKGEGQRLLKKEEGGDHEKKEFEPGKVRHSRSMGVTIH